MQLRGVSVNRGLRELVALTFVVTILAIQIWSFGDPAVSSRRPVFFAFIDFAFMVFTMGAGYVVFGKRVIDSAIDTVKKFRGGEG